MVLSWARRLFYHSHEPCSSCGPRRMVLPSRLQMMTHNHGALCVAEGANAENIVGKRHDVAEVGLPGSVEDMK